MKSKAGLAVNRRARNMHRDQAVHRLMEKEIKRRLDAWNPYDRRTKLREPTRDEIWEEWGRDMKVRVVYED